MSTEYYEGVNDFLKFSSRKTTKDGIISCPCVKYVNSELLNIPVVHDHLVSFGFLRVIKHGFFTRNHCKQRLLLKLVLVMSKKSLMNMVIFVTYCMTYSPCIICQNQWKKAQVYENLHKNLIKIHTSVDIPFYHLHSIHNMHGSLKD